jgi:hypothetical protein
MKKKHKEIEWLKDTSADAYEDRSHQKRKKRRMEFEATSSKMEEKILAMEVEISKVLKENKQMEISSQE